MKLKTRVLNQLESLHKLGKPKYSRTAISNPEEKTSGELRQLATVIDEFVALDGTQADRDPKPGSVEVIRRKSREFLKKTDQGFLIQHKVRGANYGPFGQLLLMGVRLSQTETTSYSVDLESHQVSATRAIEVRGRAGKLEKSSKNTFELNLKTPD